MFKKLKLAESVYFVDGNYFNRILIETGIWLALEPKEDVFLQA